MSMRSLYHVLTPNLALHGYYLDTEPPLLLGQVLLQLWRRPRRLGAQGTVIRYVPNRLGSRREGRVKEAAD